VLHAGQPRAVVDLADVPLVDGQALEVLLDIHDLCMEGGGQLRLASASPLVQDILEVTEVSAVVEHHSNATLAVGSFAR
jgi:anti-anti-sigma factor